MTVFQAALRMMKLPLFCALAGTAPAQAADEPGDFTHYVLALSWNAAWCQAEGDARNNGRGADQCHPRHAHGWLLHGLWPQAERGWPEYCRSALRDPSRRMSREMTDIMGSSGLAWHQWKKHGRCSGLQAADYYALSREAYEAIARPELLRRVSKPVTLDPDIIKQAFLEANPDLKPSGIAVTCRDGQIREVRICLSKALVPRACTAQVARGCRSQTVEFLPMR
ncbi:MAG: ribonuclease T2 [Pseudomonadota bacterium]